jgi:cell division inhibitor SepF
MGFMDELKKLTQPYDDDDDFFEGASESERSSAAAVSAAQMQFESAFGEESVSAPEPAEKESAPKAPSGGGLFGAFGSRRAQSKPRNPLRERTVNFGGSDTQVILFNPKTFDEAGELVGHMLQSRSVVMTLEGVPTENARRLLDFMSGIAFALQGKITPISAKTYFVTPQNVDVVGAQSDAPETGGDYF